MALNDTFTIQEINLDKKELSYDNKLIGIMNVQNIRVTTIARFFVIKNFYFLGILTLDFYIIPVLKNNQIERRPSK